MLNGLPWKWKRNHSVIFEVAPKYYISESFIDSEGYSISSEGFLLMVVDIRVIGIKFTPSSPFYFTDSLDVDVQSCHLLLDEVQFTLIHGPNIPGSYEILFFTASDFTFTTRYIHNWASFLLWPTCFILTGAVHNCPPLFPSSILDTYWPGVLIFQFHTFFFFYILFVEFSRQWY